MPEAEAEDQETDDLFQQIRKKNFPILAKEIDFQEVQEIQRDPKNLDPGRSIPRHIISYPRLNIRRES